MNKKQLDQLYNLIKDDKKLILTFATYYFSSSCPWKFFDFKLKDCIKNQPQGCEKCWLSVLKKEIKKENKKETKKEIKKEIKYPQAFYNYFGNKEDVFSDFKIDKTQQYIKIIYANYMQESWEGYAFVLFIENNKLYEVNGSHCSCYGLENQWDPEETSIDALLYRIKEGNLNKWKNLKTTLIKLKKVFKG